MSNGPVMLDKKGSDSTIITLEMLLSDAQKGELVGIAFVALHRRRRFFLGATGEVRRNPVFSRGMLACLDDALAEMTR